MRKTTAAASVIALTALALVGCSSAPTTPEACGREANTAPDLLGVVDVSGDLGAAPTVDFPKPFVATTTEHADVVTGDGPVIESLDQPVWFDMTFIDGGSGDQVPVTTYSGDDWQVQSLQPLADTFPALGDAFLCASEGSRVVLSFGEKGGSETLTGGAIDPTHALAVIDIHRVLPAAADGTPVYNTGHGMPSVVRTPGGVPGVTIPTNQAAPSEQRTLTLLKGDGEEIASDDLVLAQRLTVSWDTGSVQSSTWTDGVLDVAPLEALPEGVADALEGATVGSQIVTVVPDEQNGALVHVIDVLGVSDMPTA